MNLRNRLMTWMTGKSHGPPERITARVNEAPTLYMVICGARSIGPFESSNLATQAGLDCFKKAEFVVARVEENRIGHPTTR
jgi:hypothetical protein